MSVPAAPTSIPYLGDGSTVAFSFPYRYLAPTDLQVSVLDSTTGVTSIKALNVDYTVTGTADSTAGGYDSGTVTFAVAPTSTQTITLDRVLPLAQPDGFSPEAGIDTPTLNRGLDRAILICQQLTSQIEVFKTTGRTGDFACTDVSNGGSSPLLQCSPGNYRDSNTGTTYIPTSNGVALTTPSPLVVGSTDKVAYFQAVIDSTTGFMTGDIELKTAPTMPEDTATMAYQLITNINVVVSSGVATIQILGGGLSGSQNYVFCGTLPATTGAGHLFNS